MILVFDTETTGLTLHPDAPANLQPKIIEFGAALLDRKTGEVRDTINLLIDPGEQLDPIITKITGITNDDLAGGPDFSTASKRIVPFFERASVAVAHNLPFDRDMWRNEWRRAYGPDSTAPWPKSECCTVGLFRAEWGRDMKLLELYEDILGKPLAQTHRALEDVMALVEILQANSNYKALP
jgi:DNA polymerase III epsilon subunit-like protein